MSQMLKPGVIVDTVFGKGQIVDFEHCVIGAPCFKNYTYVDGCRIGVMLDKPSNWPCHSKKSGLPYFLLSDLLDWELS
jgi:hypothetical protein